MYWRLVAPPGSLSGIQGRNTPFALAGFVHALHQFPNFIVGLARDAGGVQGVYLDGWPADGLCPKAYGARKQPFMDAPVNG